jgi:uncharacterized protein
MLSKLSNEKQPAASLLLLLGLFLVFYVLGNLLAAIFMVLIGLDRFDMENLGNFQSILMQSTKGWWTLVLGQGIGHMVIFLGTSFVFWKLIEGKPWAALNFTTKKISLKTIAAIVLTMLLFMPFNGWLATLNEGLKLPASMSGLESFLKNMENTLADFTKYMGSFTSFPQFMVTFFVVAVLAGVGEEVLFRGLVQRKMWKGTGNIHLAIWLSAAVFSFIHMQFYGFLPRMFLGALMGYLYYFSGNIWVPIVAHVFNNGLAVVVMYLSNLKAINFDIEDTNNVPTWAAGLSIVLGFGFMYLFKKDNHEVEQSI